MTLKTKNVKLVECREWDRLVKEAYGRPYCLQQQNGCMDRGSIGLTVPEDCSEEEADMHDTVPELINGEEMGVKFGTWLERDPKRLSKTIDIQWKNNLFWERNFYPLLQTVANDLYSKGLLEAGEYVIDIDW